MASMDSKITMALNEDDRKLLKRIIELLERLDESGFENAMDRVLPRGDCNNLGEQS